MVSVEFAGPPPVKLTDSSNSCNVPLIDIIVVSKIVGRSSGIVILRKIANRLKCRMFQERFVIHCFIQRSLVYYLYLSARSQDMDLRFTMIRQKIHWWIFCSLRWWFRLLQRWSHYSSYFQEWVYQVPGSHMSCRRFPRRFWSCCSGRVRDHFRWKSLRRQELMA